MNRKTCLWLVVVFVLVISASGCAGAAAPEPTTPISPITIGDDLTSIDLCKAIPQEDIEAVMNTKFDAPPTQYSYPSEKGTSGCYFEGPTDNINKEKAYAYVVLTKLEAYDNQTLYKNVAVSGIGDQAYFNGGRNKRELWVKIDNKVAFVVAFGDAPNEAGAKAIAKLMVEAIQ